MYTSVEELFRICTMSKQQSNKSQRTFGWMVRDTSQKSLTRETLVKTGISIGIVIIGSTTMGYFQLMSRFTTESLSEVEKYALLRAERESSIFIMAQDNHVTLKQALLDRLQSSTPEDFQEKFEERLSALPDGTIRNRPNTFNVKKTPGVFLGQNVKINADIQQRVMTYFDIIQSYGSAWYNRFFNTYIQIPENGLVVYMPDNNWTQNAPSDKSFRVTDDESFYITDKKHDPQRKTVWTGIYYDSVMKNWMAACVTPVDINGRHVATLGHDILISDLQNRTIKDTLEGTYNMIFRADGRLVAHPYLMNRIQESGGKYNISESQDVHLRTLFKLVTERSTNQVILDNPDGDAYLAITKIKGPDWYFVTVFPKSLLSQRAFNASRTILLVGIASLLIEIVVIFYILRNQLSAPLIKLMRATESIAAGDLDIELDITRQDELGRLAFLFNKMAQQLRESFTTLAQTNENLEVRVEERTADLKEAMELADAANHAKSDFLASMSHELRTPLNGILGYAQILDRSPTLTERDRRGIQIIDRCGSHLLTLINDVLDLSKIEANKLEIHPHPTHLPTLMQGVIEMCRIKAEQKGLDFIYDPPSDLPPGILVDEKRLRQVLINLLGNAVKFTEQGQVTLRITVVAKPEFLVGENAARTLCFQIEDTGVGMTLDQVQKIFVPFEQVGDTKKQAEGTGLGLSISQKIVEGMGGSIRVRSLQDVGSVFEFEIDCSLAEAWAQTDAIARRQTITGYEGDPQTILVLDDSWENRSVILHLLEPLGFTVLEACDGYEGLTQAAQHHPDLIITDLAMPKMDGWEFLRQLRQAEELKDTIAVVSSASVFERDRQRSLDAGGTDFLPKPVRAEELYDMVAKHLDLTWVEAEAHTPAAQSKANLTLIIPPVSELAILLDYAKKGQIKGLQEELENLAQLNQSYQPFVNHLSQAAKGFNIQKIRQFLQESIPESTLNLLNR
jgi:signal transduction histidine kinase/FixJ family two-component response regulator